MSFGPQEICRVCGKINYEGRIVCNKCEEPWDFDLEPLPAAPQSPDTAHDRSSEVK